MADFPFKDPALSLEDRVQDLVARLTLEEKVSQMVYESRAIPRLGVPEYNWWNEGLHGVGRAGIATVFPQAIGLAASFNPALVQSVAAVISDEARAKHHELARHGYRRQYQGLTCWSPNVNLFRDPRWGRGQETYGEDPFLTGRMGVAFVRGLQGDDPRYLKLVATPKHFAAHSGPEALRHHFDAQVSQKDLRETYLPAFRDCVIEGGAESVMGAYSRTNGEACSASPTLLGKILRDEWGFKGYVVSDCGAVLDLHAHHTITSTPEQSAALAVRNGCDLECGRIYPVLVDSVAQGLVTEKEIDRALSRLLRARFRLGMFDPEERVPYASIPYETLDSPAHRTLALTAARESLVLLKNEGEILPLSKEVACIAVIGPNADDREVLFGNYNGLPSRSTTVLEGIRNAVSPSTRVIYARGCDIQALPEVWGERVDDGFGEALAAAERAEVVVLVLGLSNRLEGEEGSADESEWKGDRLHIDLPEIQRRLFEAVRSKGKPVVLVVVSGSPLAIPSEHEGSKAVLLAWYPGEEGGAAVADVLFGDYNPAGRLPVTFVSSADQLPPYTDYSMKGRTYRYMSTEPLYPFGYGLSFTRFTYGKPSFERSSITTGEGARVSFELVNSGTRAGDEVVELYLQHLTAKVQTPRRQLVGFARVHLAAEERRTVDIEIPNRRLSVVDEDGNRFVEPGKVRLYVGGRQPDKRSEALAGTIVQSVEIELKGTKNQLPF